MLFKTQGVMFKVKLPFTKKLSTSFIHYALVSSFQHLKVFVLKVQRSEKVIKTRT